MARPANPELGAEILKAAAFIVEDCGPDCVTMRQVAERVGYSPTTIYLYYKDKSALLRASVHAAFAELAEACDIAMVGPRALDKLRQRNRAYIVWGIMHPGHYRLMFELSEELQFSEEDFELVRVSLASGTALVREAIASGELREGTEPDETAEAIWAALHGATSLAISGRLTTGARAMSGPETVEVASRAADTLVNGLLAAASA